MIVPTCWNKQGVIAVFLAGLLLLGVVASGCSGSSSAGATAPGQATVWLCRPGQSNNPCLAKLTSTVDGPDGATSVQSSTPAKRPAVDCFYVYPTVSPQPTVNANLTIDPAEKDAAVTQASRFSQDCAVYAPMYRQITIAGGQSPASYRPDSPAGATAYDSLLGAWRDYLDHYNHGRGVVLIGHSQGASLLIKLIRSEIDGNPQTRKLLVSALIIGGNVVVPIGKDRGGSFANIPSCHSEHQTGCVIAYSAYDTTPPPTSHFTRVIAARLEPWQAINASEVARLQVLCTDPAALSGTATLDPYFTTTPFPGPFASVTAPMPSPPNPWVRYPNLYSDRCMSESGSTWLQIQDVGGPSDRRWRVTPTDPLNGLHAVDINLALGNLVKIVAAQARAFETR